MRALMVVVAGLAMTGSAIPAQGTARGVRPGQLHPDLWLPDLDGTLRRLSEFGGRKLFIFNFASW